MQKTQHTVNSDQQGLKKPLTPLDQLRRLDETFQHALSVKRRTLLEMYGEQEHIQEKLERCKNNRKQSVVVGTPSEARDLALAAMVQAHCLLEAIYDGTKVQEATPRTPRRMSGSPRKTPKIDNSNKPAMVPAVPCSRLACVSAPLMKCLTALSQSCALIERELNQSKKELKTLKAMPASNVTIRVEEAVDENDSRHSLQRQVSRPSDLPLKQKNEAEKDQEKKTAGSVGKPIGKQDTRQARQTVRQSDKIEHKMEPQKNEQEKKKFLSTSMTPSKSTKGTKSESASEIMSKSLPSSLQENENKVDSDGETDDERRRKRSLQRRWRHIGASFSLLTGGQQGNKEK